MTAYQNNTAMYAYLDQLTTPELEALLQQDMEAPDGGDSDMTMYIAEVLEKREGGVSEADREAAAHALREFLSVYAVPEGEGRRLYPCDTPDEAGQNAAVHKKRHCKPVRRALLVAAVVVCALSLVACSSGLGHFFRMVGMWTTEVFTFENQYAGEMPEELAAAAPSPSADGQYASMEAALDAYGIAESVVPAIPEGFAPAAVEVSTLAYDGRTVFCALYQKEDAYIVLQVTAFTGEAASFFEKDGREVQEYMRQGTTYYLYRNNASTCAVWYNGSLECLIDTSLSEDAVYGMINSL